MIDPDFNPYDTIMLHEQNIKEIARALNTSAELTGRLNAQLQQQQREIINLRNHILELRVDIATLLIDRTDKEQ